MRAVICSKFGSPEDLEVKEVEEPVTGANQVTVSYTHLTLPTI